MEPDAFSEAAEAQRPSRCPTCGTPYPEQNDELGCPVCMLRRVLEPGAEEDPGLSGYGLSRPEEGRFDHYEIARRDDGSFDELGRGAMGVTYKAFDVHLRCPVTLKLINEKYVGDESARLRFLREARAAASLRHPNVASVFHLGQSSRGYFYVMEFVEGETLERLIKRSDRLEVKLALEIATQVAAGLAAVHKQKLVHRDIKPSNIMVNLEEGGVVSAKIIDLGLAKALNEPGSQGAISMPGVFVGTPDFASPEQFAGVGVDIRSDLYSLGVMLWEMVVGHAPFRGSPAEVMHQHQHAPLPLDRLRDVPQPVVVLLQVLLEKDPTRRFQNPAELLKAMPTIKGAIEASRTIKQQKLRTTFVDKASARQKKSSAIRAPKRSIAVLPFDTLSQGQRNTYFADGVQDEILSNLAKVSQLKVISRTSVMTYRLRNNRDLRSIANALGVANVVEGTVRRDGNRIRITVRLVDARTDEALWSESYDRELTNIFAIQSDIAQTVAAKLSARLSPKERKDIDEEPTKSLEVYDLYLQGKESIFDAEFYSEDEHEKLLNAIGFLEAAIRKDSKFALAYCLLAKAHDDLYGWGYDRTNNRRALGDAAVNEALRLGRDLPETHLANAFHLYVCYRNHERARVQVGIAQQILPNSPAAFYLAAIIDRRQGRWETSTPALERACNLDPRNSKFLTGLGRNYKDLHRYRDAEKIYDRLIEFEPNRLLHKKNKASVAFLRTGDVPSYRAVLEALPSSLKDIPDLASERFDLALCARDWVATKQILNENTNEELPLRGVAVPRRCGEIWLAAVQGDRPALGDRFGAARDRLKQKVEANPEDSSLLSTLGVIDAILGRKDEAVQEATRAVDMRPASQDALEWVSLITNLALVYAWTNEPDLAFRELRISTQTPGGVSYGQLKTDYAFEPLRQDPRFEKLLAQMRPAASYAVNRMPSARLGPEKISVSRLPVTGSDIFGREEDIAFLDDAWANQHVNVVTIVAWAGVGKSTLINHWLGRMAVEHYRSAELVFAWSFYRQGTTGDASSADEFRDAALAWFGDPDPRIGTAWEQGERLAKLIAHRRTLLVLDGLEPLQNPPGPQEGRVREPFLQALLRELAAFNKGLCVITTRLPVADIATHGHSSAPRRDLEQLSSDAGAKLLRALGVKGPESELRTASDEFSGHSLALTLLGSYLTDAYNGDICCREEVSTRLAQDVRQGAHARTVMDSYQTWFGEGPELAVLRMLGLFDRPVDEKAMGVLLKPPSIRGLTESLTNLSPAEWQTILAKLRRARLLAGEDPNSSGDLDTHPLVREYFGEQLRSQQTDAWKECNRRLYHYHRMLAPELPKTFREMEPLFLAVICGCHAGLFREALHEVYIPRIQRGNASFAATILGVRGALLSVLVHFFEHGRWGSLVESGVDEQCLTAEDQLFILMQAALNLSATRGFSTPEARLCYERAESLCRMLDHPLLLYLALIGQWRYSLLTDSLTATMQIAKRVYSFAQEQNRPAFMIGACNALAGTLYYLGDFENARQYAMRGVHVSRSDGTRSPAEEVDAPGVTCLYFRALSEWHIGEIAAAKSSMAEAVSLAKELLDKHALVLALYHAAVLGVYERNPAEVERYTSDLIELSTSHNFASHLSGAAVLRGWARSASGGTTEGISWIEDGIRDFRLTGSILGIPFFLALKAEALHAAHRNSEALAAINEAEALVKRFENRYWCAEMHRLRGVFLATLGAEETHIETSFRAAISTAREQKSISLEKRAEATYAEYRRQKASPQEDVESDYLFAIITQKKPGEFCKTKKSRNDSSLELVEGQDQG